MSAKDVEEALLLKEANRDMRWLSENYSKLVETHNDEFVAVKDGNLVASGRSLDSVVAALASKGFDPRNVLVKYLTNSSVIL